MVKYAFPGKVVLVTGSSRGMGAAILEAFARAGAACILNYFDDPDGTNRKDAEQTADRMRAHQVPVQVFEANVSKYESVQALMGQIKDTAGGLDILVNNAGILRDRTMKKMTPDDWHSVLDTNLDGVFYCSKLGAEIMRDGGRIVNPNFMDYLLPTATDIPDEIVPITIESRRGDGPYGAKGIGEPPIVGVSPAVANAIEDAVGVRIRDLPITPERVARALNPIDEGDRA